MKHFLGCLFTCPCLTALFDYPLQKALILIIHVNGLGLIPFFGVHPIPSLAKMFGRKSLLKTLIVFHQSCAAGFPQIASVCPSFICLDKLLKFCQGALWKLRFAWVSTTVL